VTLQFSVTRERIRQIHPSRSRRLRMHMRIEVAAGGRYNERISGPVAQPDRAAVS
jgi:hypothetical protein